MRAEIENIISEIHKSLELLKQRMDWETAEHRMEEFDAMSENPDLWNNPEKAQKLMRERQMLSDSISNFKELTSNLQDNIDLIELGEIEEDEEIIKEAENSILTIQREAAKQELEALLNGEVDSNDTFLQINAGAGGTESCDWASMLARMYIRWAEQKGYKVDRMEESVGDEAGIKSVTYQIRGHNAYGWMKSESGVHRLVRISPFDSNAKRHTSFSSVWVYPVVDDNIDIDINPSEIRVDTYRSSGAGGQHVNTTDSAVRITHLPTGIVVECQDDRSQHRNKAQAMSVLAARIKDNQIKEQQSQIASERKSLIGSGDRSERIRTYNFPQGRITDHRINLTLYKVDYIMDGDLTELIEALTAEHQADLLAQIENE